MSKQPTSTTTKRVNAATMAFKNELNAFIHMDFALSAIGMKNV